MVVDLLDYDVRFGQGFLFSPPRPVRAEALQTLPASAETPLSADDTPSEFTAAAHYRLNKNAGRAARAFGYEPAP